LVEFSGKQKACDKGSDEGSVFAEALVAALVETFVGHRRFDRQRSPQSFR
jgi:hypothetical protein